MVAAIAALVYCASVATRQGVAAWYSRQDPPAGLQEAIAWDPENPRYYEKLAQFLRTSTRDYDADQIVQLHETAVRVMPHDAHLWAELGSVYDTYGRPQDALASYERAKNLFPNSPRIGWLLGNFYLRQGEAVKAMREFKKVLLGDPSMRQQAFALAAQATDDSDLVLEEMIPPEKEVMFQYIAYLIATERLDEAGTVWSRILELNSSFEEKQALPYLDALIRDGQIGKVKAAWKELVARNPTLSGQQGDTTLVTNGGFERNILNGGLGWHVSPVDGANVAFDRMIFFDGTRSLRIQFGGKSNLDYRHVYQYVPVAPATVYRFIGYMRTKGITTDSGVCFEVFDGQKPSRLSLSTSPTVGTTSWTLTQLEFETTPDTTLLVIRVARPASRMFDNKIAGIAWIDRIGLTPAE